MAHQTFGVLITVNPARKEKSLSQRFHRTFRSQTKFYKSIRNGPKYGCIIRRRSHYTFYANRLDPASLLANEEEHVLLMTWLFLCEPSITTYLSSLMWRFQGKDTIRMWYGKGCQSGTGWISTKIGSHWLCFSYISWTIWFWSSCGECEQESDNDVEHLKGNENASSGSTLDYAVFKDCVRFKSLSAIHSAIKLHPEMSPKVDILRWGRILNQGMDILQL